MRSVTGQRARPKVLGRIPATVLHSLYDSRSLHLGHSFELGLCLGLCFYQGVRFKWGLLQASTATASQTALNAGARLDPSTAIRLATALRSPWIVASLMNSSWHSAMKYSLC